MDANLQNQDRNYNIISPTAKYVLLFKGNTEIPYARKVAEIISLPEKYEPETSQRDFAWWGRVVHLEERYNSINQLLFSQPHKNILELSSGYSFRGLDAIKDHDLYYIDTDLPELIGVKMELMKQLRDQGTAQQGKLEIVPLNALDEQQFTEVTSHFPDGEITIVNEGLLMYLDIDEKKKLCANIRNALQKRGGCWITADIYIKTSQSFVQLQANDKLTQLMETLDVEKNKFESFEAAEEFFKNEGFVIDVEAAPGYANLPSLKYLLESATKEQISTLGGVKKIHATWRLKLAN